MSVNGPISPKQCYYEMDYSLYSVYWLDSLEIRLDHNSTYYRSLSKNSDVKPRVSHCDSQNLQYKTHPEFWPSHRRIFKTSLYYKTRLILETRRYSWCYSNSNIRNSNSNVRGSFCVCAQPMTMLQCNVSLAEPMHRMIPGMKCLIVRQWSWQSLDMSDISDGQAQMSDEKFHNFE